MIKYGSPVGKTPDISGRSKRQKIKYVYGLCRRRHDQGQLSTLRQIAEIIWLRITRGYGYSTYHFAEMWCKDASWNYKCGFLSHRNFVKKIYDINQRKYHGLTQFKPNEKAFLNLFHIPCSEYLGILHSGWGIAGNGKIFQTAKDLNDLLAQHVGEKICFKLLEGSGGKGFKAYLILQEKDRILLQHIISAETYTPEELFPRLLKESPGGWLLEKYIVQHPVISALNPDSLNTIRMYVFQDKNGVTSIPGAFLRIGRQSSLVDNSAGGGLVSRIDPATGKLHPACEWSPELAFSPVHPDHGARIAGVILPFWPQARALGMRTLRVLPGTRFAGLDIAITETGPVMVEVNIQPDSDGLAFMKIPTARVFMH